MEQFLVTFIVVVAKGLQLQKAYSSLNPRNEHSSEMTEGHLHVETINERKTIRLAARRRVKGTGTSELVRRNGESDTDLRKTCI